MNELLLIFFLGMILGFLIKAILKSVTSLIAFICMIAVISGIFAGRTDITILGTSSLFGITALRNGRRNVR